MNKIYRTVYNETTGTWVAVEETAKSHRKSAGVVNESAPAREAGSLKKISVIAAVAAMVLPFMAETAQADVLCRVTSGANSGKYFIRPTACNSNERSAGTINLSEFVVDKKINPPDKFNTNADGSLVMQNSVPVLGGGTINVGYRGTIFREGTYNYYKVDTFQRSGATKIPGSTTNATTAQKAETPGATGDNDIAIGTNATAHGDRVSKDGVDFKTHTIRVTQVKHPIRLM